MNSYEKRIQRKRWRDVRGTSDVINGGHIGSNGEGRKGEKLPMALKRDSVQWKRGGRTYLSVGELDPSKMETSQGLYSWNVGAGYCIGRV